MIQVHTRGGVFGPGGYGGGIFDGSDMGFGGLGCVEQAAAGVRGLGNTPWQWMATDPQLAKFQVALNKELTARGYKPIGTDGQLGPATCGALTWLGLQKDVNYNANPDLQLGLLLVSATVDGPAVQSSSCKALTMPTKVGASSPDVLTSTYKAQLPWGAHSAQTAQVQLDLNDILDGHGYGPVPTDGVLDATTCGAMQLAKTAWGDDFLSSYGGNCQAFTAPTKKPPVCPAGYSVVNGTCVHDAVTSCPSGYSLVNGVCAQNAASPPAHASSKASMTGWVVGGLLVAAGVAAVAASKKKR
jgi:hypothetical protein